LDYKLGRLLKMWYNNIMKEAITYILTVSLIILAVFVAVDMAVDKIEMPVGSVNNGNEYNATSTAQNTVYGAFSANRAIKQSWGTLGSVVITGANTGIINFYNATTSDITARTGNTATSSLLIASIPASLAAGTYVFDLNFTDGLFLDLVSGNMPTTTITYR